VWSEQQEAVFANFRFDAKHAIVRARAGCAKTTTSIEALNYVPARYQRILLAAFNKIIAQELQSRITDPRVEAKTLHSLGMSYVMQNWEGVRVDASKRAWGLVEEHVEASTPDAIKGALKELHTKVRELDPWVSDVKEIERLAVVYDLVPGEETWTRVWTEERFYETVLEIINSAAQDDDTVWIDFADMIFLPLRNGWVFPRYDMVVVDEAQDMSRPQLVMAQRAVRAGGRIVIVGDDRQAIYGFRGADSKGLDRLKAELEASELGLTTTYRCGKAIVQRAAALVPDFCAADSAPDGVVRYATPAEMTRDAAIGDFVLSRTNAPLMGAALGIIRRGVRARVRGRDIGKGLIELVKKLKVTRLGDLYTELEAWQAREMTRISKRNPELARVKAQGMQDTIDTLNTLAETVESLRELNEKLAMLFTDEDASAAVMCSTVHKAKGLETRRVWVLEDTMRSGNVEEENIRYVAYTRAKDELVLVTERGGPKDEITQPQPAA